MPKKEHDYHKEYLGDSVYAAMEPDGLAKLTTENGGDASNIIYLEPQVAHELIRYLERYMFRTPNFTLKTDQTVPELNRHLAAVHIELAEVKEQLSVLKRAMRDDNLSPKESPCAPPLA